MTKIEVLKKSDPVMVKKIIDFTAYDLCQDDWENLDLWLEKIRSKFPTATEEDIETAHNILLNAN